MITAQSASDNAPSITKLVRLRTRWGRANRGVNLWSGWVSVLIVALRSAIQSDNPNAQPMVSSRGNIVSRITRPQESARINAAMIAKPNQMKALPAAFILPPPLSPCPRTVVTSRRVVYSPLSIAAFVRLL